MRGGHNASAETVAYSRDGRRIASRDVRGIAKIWDAASGEELLTLRGPGGETYSVIFGPEDQWLASSCFFDRTICVWEATPLTAELRLQREAAALVNDLPAELGSKGEILGYLRALPSLSEPLRERALSMAERLQEDPWRLNRASDEVVWQSGLDAARYRLALRQAEAARDLAYPGFNFSPSHHVTRVIGIAHYRLGEYKEAVAALTASEAHLAAAQFYGSKAGHPTSLAFLAMAHHRLGEKEAAQAILARLHRVMKDPRWASEGDHHTYYREAEELCVWGGPPPTEDERRLRREAADLVNGLPAALGFKDEILADLRTRPRSANRCGSTL